MSCRRRSSRPATSPSRTITSQTLTRRLILSAYIDSDDAGAAMAIARSVLLSHLYEHGPEYRRVGIHHTDATPACASS